MPSHTPARQTVSVKPIGLSSPGRDVDLHLRVTAPREGRDLPVIVFSHGNAWSMDGYGPLVDRWAAAGFLVVQPTHPDSRRIGITPGDPRFATIWRLRINDLHAVLDHLPDVLADAGAQDRADLGRIALVGHSWGAQTVGALLGARVRDAAGVPGEDFSHPAPAAGVLITAPGTGETLTSFAAEHLPFMRPDFSTMETPALVVAGGRDHSQLSTRGPDWFTDAYHRSPSPKALLTLAEAEHTMGGIAGEAVAETSDENPARVAFLADTVTAYLQASLGVDGSAWAALGRNGTGEGGGWEIVSK
ncbi:alpha/beta hydrolase family protein [Streptomyces bohaiensis]|uniref:Alpha/beta fold hydrolase n=1 Tax=Streptomyces bohaiensis TaxID=1431344 RepID=A0ABX1C8Q5_9ACTN|nr:alpha/beta fold hydrolase [Streptomyces bohaiensis]NJQ15516.1 alpha/beta fold hydrolase [Streptomyces bohaiensis]